MRGLMSSCRGRHIDDSRRVRRDNAALRESRLHRIDPVSIRSQSSTRANCLVRSGRREREKTYVGGRNDGQIDRVTVVEG